MNMSRGIHTFQPSSFITQSTVRTKGRAPKISEIKCSIIPTLIKAEQNNILHAANIIKTMREQVFFPRYRVFQRMIISVELKGNYILNDVHL